MKIERRRRTRDRIAVRGSMGGLVLLVLLALAVAPGVARADDAATPAGPAGGPPTPATAAPSAPSPVPPANATNAPGGAATAEPPIEESGVATLPGVVVEAPTLTPHPLYQSTAAVNAITARQLQREQPSDASDAFVWRTGLWTVQGSAGHMGTPVIRGLTGNQVLFLFDGVRLSDTYTPPGPNGYWEMVDMETVDHIEVLRSPDSVLYGTQAIGGVTAFYTGWPVDYTSCGTTVGGRVKLAGALGGETFGRVRLQGHFATPRMRMVLGGTGVWADDLRGGEDVGTLEPTRYKDQAGDFRYEWRVTPTGTLGVSFFATHKRWPDNFVFVNRVQDNARDREIGIVRWRERRRTALFDDAEIRLAFVHYGQSTDRHDNPKLDELDDYTPQLDVILHKKLSPRHLLTYGVHAHRDTIDSRLTTPAGTTRPIPEGYFQNAGVYAQDEWNVTRKLHVVGGLRFDVANAKTDPKAATTDPLINPDDVRIDKWDTAWTGKLGVLYQVTPCLNFAANLTRGYRFPSLENLAGFVQHPDEIAVGNRDVSPEYSTNVELTAHVRTRKFDASVTFFQSWYDDLIIAQYGTFHGMTYIDRNGNGVEDPDESVFLTANAGTARSHGVEINADYALLPTLTAFGNFTWWHGTFHPDPTEPLGLPTNGTLGLRWEPSSRFWIQGSAHMVRRYTQIPSMFYFSEQFFFRDPQDASAGTLRSTPKVPGYTTFDLRGGVQLRRNVELILGVENLLNRRYRAYGSRHQGPGTTVLATLSVDF